MNVMQEALMQACENLSIPYEVLHKDQIVVRVLINGQKYHYIHWFLPFNRADVQRILRDKDLQYTLLQNVIAIPKWKSYLASEIDEEYSISKRGDSKVSLKKVRQDIKNHFDLPVLVKPNMGSKGRQIKVCQTVDEALQAVLGIFEKTTDRFSYIALIQQFITIKNEYRVVGYKEKALLVYKKDIAQATFAGNLSPLHWEGSKAIHVIDVQTIQRVEAFVAPVFRETDLLYGGFDVAEDTEGNLWLLEINRQPQIAIFVRDNGLEPVVRMHEEILRDLTN